jgi:hypothetical protein
VREQVTLQFREAAMVYHREAASAPIAQRSSNCTFSTEKEHSYITKKLKFALY